MRLGMHQLPFELIRLIKEGIAKPDLIIGMPVGFVSAAESKEELAKMKYPFITNVGEKVVVQ